MTHRPVNPASATTPEPGAAILDAFIPGYSAVFRFLSSYFHIDNSSYLLIVVVLLAITRSLWSHLLANCLRTSIEICSDDELFTAFRVWESEQEFLGESSSLRAETGTRNDLPWYTRKDDLKDGDALNQKEIHYKFMGKILFIRGPRVFWITRCEDSSSPWDTRGNRIIISCFPGSQSVAKQIVREIWEARLKRNGEYVLVYIGEASPLPNWKLRSKISRRDESTVVIDPEQKKLLFDDIENYLKPDTRKWHQIRGIPYRWGCVFYGPPGTGKTSLIISIASKYGLAIYTLNLGIFTEQSLIELIGKLPGCCILLVEDIDCSGISWKHEAASTYVKDRTRADECQSAFRSEKESQGLSLASILNVMDGVLAPEGHLLFVTTNNLESLPESFLRPGRIDRKVCFDYADEGIAEALFRSFYRTSIEESQLELLSKKFGETVAKKERIPAAEIQNYFLRHRDSPEDAVKGQRIGYEMNSLNGQTHVRNELHFTVPAYMLRSLSYVGIRLVWNLLLCSHHPLITPLSFLHFDRVLVIGPPGVANFQTSKHAP